MGPKDADRMANSVDPDLGPHCLPDLSVQKLRIIMVIMCQFSHRTLYQPSDSFSCLL